MYRDAYYLIVMIVYLKEYAYNKHNLHIFNKKTIKYLT